MTNAPDVWKILSETYVEVKMEMLLEVYDNDFENFHTALSDFANEVGDTPKEVLKVFAVWKIHREIKAKMGLV